MIKLLRPLILLMIGHVNAEVGEQQQLQYQFNFDNVNTPEIIVENIWGNIRVATHAQNSVLISIDESRRAPDQNRFDKSKELLFLDIKETSNGVAFIVDGMMRNQWHQRNPCRGCVLEMQFELTVPEHAALKLSIVNDGDVVVKGASGAINANNINGNLQIEQAAKCGQFNTINGDIDIDYRQPPEGQCHYETINGDINIKYPGATNADLSLNLTHGTIHSEFDVIAISMAPKIDKKQSKGRTLYRYQQSTGLRIGQGGKEHYFKSMNGDVTIDRL